MSTQNTAHTEQDYDNSIDKHKANSINELDSVSSEMDVVSYPPEPLSDLTVTISGKAAEFRVHKSILALSSTYFATLIESTKDNTVELPTDMEFSVSEVKTLFDVLYNKRVVRNITLIDNRDSTMHDNDPYAYGGYGASRVGTLEYFISMEMDPDRAQQFANRYAELKAVNQRDTAVYSNSNEWTFNDLVTLIRTANYFDCKKAVDDCVAVFKSLVSSENDLLNTLVLADELRLDAWIDAIIDKFRVKTQTNTTDNKDSKKAVTTPSYSLQTSLVQQAMTSVNPKKRKIAIDRVELLNRLRITTASKLIDALLNTKSTTTSNQVNYFCPSMSPLLPA